MRKVFLGVALLFSVASVAQIRTYTTAQFRQIMPKKLSIVPQMHKFEVTETAVIADSITYPIRQKRMSANTEIYECSNDCIFVFYKDALGLPVKVEFSMAKTQQWEFSQSIAYLVETR